MATSQVAVPCWTADPQPRPQNIGEQQSPGCQHWPICLSPQPCTISCLNGVGHPKTLKNNCVAGEICFLKCLLRCNLHILKFIHFINFAKFNYFLEQFTDLCTHTMIKFWKISSPYERRPCAHFLSVPVCLLWSFHARGVRQCVLLGVWLLWCSRIFWR